MAWVRRVRTASGATAVQIAESVGGRRRIVTHVGSAHTDAELGLLLERARELLADPGQGQFELGVEPTPRRAHRVAGPVEPRLLIEPAIAVQRPHTAAGRVVGTSSRLLFDVLAQVYAALGFDAAVRDEVFRDLVIARVVEPTSILDMGRVLSDLGQPPASDKTLRRTPARVQQRGYRDQVATACFAHAATAGDVSLCLYDVTVRHEALVVRAEVRDLCLIPCRSRGFAAEGSLTGETTGRAGAALTKPWRVRTVGWRGRGERVEEVYARNRCHHLS